MKEVGQKVATDSQLWVRGIRIGHRGERTRLETVVGFSLLAKKVAIFKEPRFGFPGDLLVVRTDTERKWAVRYQVWEDECSDLRLHEEDSTLCSYWAAESFQ